MGQAGNALTCCCHLAQIYHRADNSNLITAVGKNLPPGVDDERVPIAFAAACDLTNGAGRNNKSRIFYCARSVEDMPMGFSRFLCEGSRNQQNFGT